MSKMHGKQKLVSGFDLDAFAGGADKPADTQPKAPKPKPASRPTRKPAVPATTIDKVSERVQVMLTKDELDQIKEKAGLVPVSKWLRNELKGKGII